MGDSSRAPYPPPDVVHSFRTPSQIATPQRVQQNPYPPSDISSLAFRPHPQDHELQHPGPDLRTSQSAAPPESAPPRGDFLIIALFALHLTQRMLTSLPDYTHRAADLSWLSDFLSPYDPTYDLAKICGGAKADFLDTYPRIVSRMKTQDKFRVRFMSMNPLMRERGNGPGQRKMDDDDRRDIIDFVDAAAEWGSTVPLPRDEAESILKMADQRLVADLEIERGGVDTRGRRENPVMAREQPLQRVLQDRYVPGDDYNIRRR